jgi:hypothetical protein
MFKISYWELSLMDFFNLLKKDWGIGPPFDYRVVQTSKQLKTRWQYIGQTAPGRNN